MHSGDDNFRAGLSRIETIGYDLSVASSSDEVKDVLDRVRELLGSDELTPAERQTLEEKRLFSHARLGHFHRAAQLLRELSDASTDERFNRVLEALGVYLEESEGVPERTDVQKVLDVAMSASNPASRAELIWWLVRGGWDEPLSALSWERAIEDFYERLGLCPVDDSLRTFASMFDAYREDAERLYAPDETSDSVSPTGFTYAYFRHRPDGKDWMSEPWRR